MIEVIRYCNARRFLWDEFLPNSKNSTFLFYRNFMDYHSDRFRDFSILVLEDGKLKSILPANLDLEGNLHSHQGLTYGGFVFNKN